MAKGYLPSRDTELAAFATNMSTLVTATPSAYGISTAIATQLATATTAYKTALQTATDPSTRTKPNVLTKDNAKKALVAIIRAVAKIAYGTPSVTESARADLGLPPPKPWTPIPAPTSAPKLTVVGVSGLTATIKLENPDATKRGKPSGCTGCSVMSFVGEQPPQNMTDWAFEGSTANVQKIEVQFPAGTSPFARVWLTAFYYTARGLSGPACTPVSLNLGSWVVQAQEPGKTLRAA